MEGMGQREHIEALLEKSSTWEKKASSIQATYEKYMSVQSDGVFEELVRLLDGYCMSWVKRHLRNMGCDNDENEHAALQAAHMAIWEYTQKKYREEGDFAYYAFGIYKKKTLDVTRKISRARAKATLLSMEGFEEEGKDIDAILPHEVVEDIAVQGEKQKVYKGVFRTYCAAFMASKAFPPKNLALCYARVLPHLMGEIPDSKATSAKWAFERMGGQTVLKLKEDSEKTLKEDVDGGLQWGPAFVKQLKEKVDIPGKTGQLGDIIYTSVYQKGKIEDWAESMHKAAMRDSQKLIAQDRELQGLVKEYVLQDGILGRFLKQERGGCR